MLPPDYLVLRNDCSCSHCFDFGNHSVYTGKGVVSQEFRERKWKILSLDNANDSNATCKMDILTVNPADLPFVPDFIWASPPCQTYSKMTGNKHRHPRSGDFEKSPAARAHNFLFTKMSEILRWAKQRHPHLIVVIENPQGLMSKMPLMVSRDALLLAELADCSIQPSSSV